MTSILITGAGGHVGRAVLRHLAGLGHDVLATDLHPIADLPEGVDFAKMDVTKPADIAIIETYKPQVIVHLASIVTPVKDMTRAQEYDVDVEGTKRVYDAARRAGTRRIVITSSGAAYGYHADNAVPLRETDPLRGNESFAYACHKRQVEEFLAQRHTEDAGLEQVILRVGTVLGAEIENQITALFHKPRILGIIGSDSPFVFIWDEDLAAIVSHAATDAPAGIYNVAGDGWMSISEIAQALGKPMLWVPAWALIGALFVASKLGLSRYGPEQVKFLRYRPVLDNSRLKQGFGYCPTWTSQQAFTRWRDLRIEKQR